MALLTLLRGEISTACLLITPALPIRVASSRGPLHSDHSQTLKADCSHLFDSYGNAGPSMCVYPLILLLVQENGYRQQQLHDDQKILRPISQYVCSLSDVHSQLLHFWMLVILLPAAIQQLLKRVCLDHLLMMASTSTWIGLLSVKR